MFNAPAHFMPPPPYVQGVPSFWTCPFCGGEFGQPHEIEPYNGSPNFWQVGCITCRACGPKASSIQEAIDKWNKRIEAKEIT